jgi:hypothetical protein
MFSYLSNFDDKVLLKTPIKTRLPLKKVRNKLILYEQGM